MVYDVYLLCEVYLLSLKKVILKNKGKTISNSRNSICKKPFHGKKGNTGEKRGQKPADPRVQGAQAKGAAGQPASLEVIKAWAGAGAGDAELCLLPDLQGCHRAQSLGPI